MSIKRSTSLFVSLIIAVSIATFVQAKFSVNPVQATIFEPEAEKIEKNDKVQKLQVAPTGNIVRVGISSNDFSSYTHNQIKLTSDGSLSLINKKNSIKIIELPPKSILNITMKNGSFIPTYRLAGTKESRDVFLSEKLSELVVIPSNGLTQVVGLQRKGMDAVYRGVFEFTPFQHKSDTFALVNVLDIETYLRGVVPNEMPISFGNEALKAQAVAARNYVLKPRIKYYKEYDICDSVACQVYFGANTENLLSDMAITQTEGNVATYKGELILAQYSSTAGGYTENYENCFTSQKDKCLGCDNEAIPYLKGKPDNSSSPILSKEEEARKFYTTTPDSFDSESPYFRWQREWTKEELQNTLAKRINDPAFEHFIRALNPSQKEFGELQNIEVLERGVSGKVISLKIVTDKNEFIVQKELVVRRLFKKDGKDLPSANIVFDIVKEKIPVEKKVSEDTSKNITNPEQEVAVKNEQTTDTSKNVVDVVNEEKSAETTNETVKEEILKDIESAVTQEKTNDTETELVANQENGQETPKLSQEQEYIEGDNIEKIVVYGGGFGHGVGMSQFGAGKMHDLGYRYDEILQHYYSGIAITTPIAKLNVPENVTTITQSFWAPYQKAALYVDNVVPPAKIAVSLNGNIFEMNFEKNTSRKVYTDISQYINVGKNKVTYSVVGGDNKKQETNIYIELKEAVND